jgi:exosortase
VPVRLVIVVALLALAHAPLLVAHARQMALRPHYHFLPLAVAGAGVLLVARLRDGGPLTPGKPVVSAILLAANAALLVAAELLSSSWLAMVAALVAVAAVAHAVGGSALWRRLWPAWLLLALALPPPLELDRNFILWLQTVTVRASSAVLDLCGVYHVLAGHVVELGGRPLLVEEACSGVHSFFAALACALFYAGWNRRGPAATAVLVLATAGWVLAANVARVVAVASGVAWQTIDLTDGWRHEALGLLLFGAVLGLLWSTDHLLLFLTAPIRARAGVPGTTTTGSATVGEPAQATQPALGGSWLAGWAVAAVYAALLLGHFALDAAAGPSAPAQGPVATHVDRLRADTLPAQLGCWQREAFDHETRNPGSAFGEFSQVWRYRQGETQALFSVDYAFPCWHDLSRCYTGNGWEVEAEAVHEADRADAVGHVEVRLAKPAYRLGYLLFCQLDGRSATPRPRQGGAQLALDRHRHQTALGRWWQRFSEPAHQLMEDPPGPVYQVQWFVESPRPLNLAQEEQALAAFRVAVERLRQTWPAGPR